MSKIKKSIHPLMRIGTVVKYILKNVFALQPYVLILYFLITKKTGNGSVDLDDLVGPLIAVQFVLIHSAGIMAIIATATSKAKNNRYRYIAPLIPYLIYLPILLAMLSDVQDNGYLTLFVLSILLSRILNQIIYYNVDFNKREMAFTAIAALIFCINIPLVFIFNSLFIYSIAYFSLMIPGVIFITNIELIDKKWNKKIEKEKF